MDLSKLYEPFPADQIHWRAQNMKADGTAALALAYLDARDVMDRLDEVCGAENWQDRYEFHGERTICYLTIRVGDEWIVKADGGGDSDIEGEKGAISGALKRAAVKWGIGRYLYDLGNTWVPCESYPRKDGKKAWKRWTADPWTSVRDAQRFLPANSPAPMPAPARQKPAAAEDSNARTIADALISASDQAKTLDAFKGWKIGQNEKIAELPEFERKRVNRHLKEVYDRLLADAPVSTLEAG